MRRRAADETVNETLDRGKTGKFVYGVGMRVVSKTNTRLLFGVAPSRFESATYSRFPAQAIPPGAA